MKPNQITHEELIANRKRFLEELVVMRKEAGERRKESAEWRKGNDERRREENKRRVRKAKDREESNELNRELEQGMEEGNERLRKMIKNSDDFDRYWKWIIIALVILQGLPWDRIFP